MIETMDKTKMVIRDTEIGMKMVYTFHHITMILGLVVRGFKRCLINF